MVLWFCCWFVRVFPYLTLMVNGYEHKYHSDKNNLHMKIGNTSYTGNYSGNRLALYGFRDMLPLVKIRRSRICYNEPNDPRITFKMAVGIPPSGRAQGKIVRQLGHNRNAMWVCQGPRWWKKRQSVPAAYNPKRGQNDLVYTREWCVFYHCFWA